MKQIVHSVTRKAMKIPKRVVEVVVEVGQLITVNSRHLLLRFILYRLGCAACVIAESQGDIERHIIVTLLKASGAIIISILDIAYMIQGYKILTIAKSISTYLDAYYVEIW